MILNLFLFVSMLFNMMTYLQIFKVFFKVIIVIKHIFLQSLIFLVIWISWGICFVLIYTLIGLEVSVSDNGLQKNFKVSDFFTLGTESLGNSIGFP